MAPHAKNSTSFARILVFNKNFFSLSETFIYRQVSLLDKHFDIDLMSFKTEQHAQYEKVGNRSVKISRKISKVEKMTEAILRRIFRIRVAYNWKASKQLRDYFRSHRSVVHAHYGWNGSYLLPILKKTSTPLVVSFHGNDASGWLKNESYVKALPELFNYASAIVLCSDHMVGALKIKDRWMDKVKMVPYGIPVHDLKPSPRQSDGYLHILHSGRLVPKKGVDDLISAFSKIVQRYPHVRLGIAGDGPERGKCQALVETLNLHAFVTFYGAVPFDQVKALMNACDVFVLNSRTDPDGDMEGLPNSILEAMAFEKPVVSTRHAGIPMAIVDGVTGLLVEEYDNAALQNALTKLIEDPRLRSRLGTEARTYAVREFSLEKMEQRLVDIFENLGVRRSS